MSRYAYVAVVQTVDPAEPQRWEVTGDVVGPAVVSDEAAEFYAINGDHGLAQTTGIKAEHLQMIVFSTFEVQEVAP